MWGREGQGHGLGGCAEGGDGELPAVCAQEACGSGVGGAAEVVGTVVGEAPRTSPGPCPE